MFYDLLHEMAIEMGFVVLVMWIAMTALAKCQRVFRWTVIGSVLLFGTAIHLGERELAMGFQLASLCLLLLGWICRVRWQIRHARSEREK